MEKKIIAVDMDDTMVYLMKSIWKDHLKKHPDYPLTYEEMKAFHYEMFHPDYDIVEYMKEPDVFYNLELIDEHVIPEMKKLHEKHDLLIVTSAFPEHVVDKWRWIEKNLPFIDHKNFMTSGRKDLIQADLLIDDAIHNLKPWVATGRPAIGMLHHWNEEIISMDNVTAVRGWKNMSDVVDTVLNLSLKS